MFLSFIPRYVDCGMWMAKRRRKIFQW